MTSPTVTANRGWKISRRYQRSLSKHTMKESRYRLNCRTHRNGLTAMSWEIRLVVASNSTEAHAARPAQNSRSDQAGDVPSARKSGIETCFGAAETASRAALLALKK